MDPSVASDEIAPLGRRQLYLAFSGLMLTLALAALDQNIVATALPNIVSDLGGLAHLSWVVTGFLLASTATTPIYGKLSDLYGRRALFFAAIAIFLAGSILCGLAETMTELIVFRFLQGLGAGGLIPLAQVTVGDLVSPRERGRYQAMFTSVFAICSVAGPLAGGFITDVLSWRWIFYVNLPIGLAATLLVAIGLPRSARRLARRIDYAGALLLTGGTSCLVLMLSWGGAAAAWASPGMLGLALGAVTLFALLVVRERVAAEPILPLGLFANRVFVVAVTVTGLTSTALSGAVVFLPAFFQIALGASASASGLMVAPLMGGLIVSATIGGRIVSAFGRYKILLILGLGTGTAAVAALAWATREGSGLLAIEAALVVLGAGLGLVMPNLTIALQNAVDRRDLGVGTSASAFFRSLGAALGVAIAGAIMARHLAGIAGLENLRQLGSLAPEARLAVAAAYREAVGAILGASTATAALALAIVLLMPERPLRRTGE